ncbi:MAG: heat-inducible transcriptional repressor HrcA [Lachnospiraceae bacterium]|nr:heat-inducible transcriptional repressor HrcA [Lachnospiraceae bacterium]
MELDERKLKILQAIIRTYLETGEPVGSRTISKYSDLNISSATIRNEMSDLEDMGYIIQPHTSAGRIPTDKGYRLYVDTMMDDKVQEVQDMKDQLEEKAGRIDTLLKHVSKLLATSTNYAAMVSGPRYRSKKIKFIQLSEVDEKHLLTIVVLDGNVVKNKMIKSDEALDTESVAKLNFLLNTALNGLDVGEVNIAVIQKIKEQAKGHSNVIDAVLEVVGNALTQDDDYEVYTSGTTNILKYPELADKEKITDILDTFEDKRLISEFEEVNPTIDTDDGNHAIQVYIGGESQVDSMKDCSMVTATYKIHEGAYGKIGIVGPKRMDYDKVVATLEKLMDELDDIFKDSN